MRATILIALAAALPAWGQGGRSGDLTQMLRPLPRSGLQATSLAETPLPASDLRQRAVPEASFPGNSLATHDWSGPPQAPASDPFGQLVRNSTWLLALEASRQPQDLGINANFGVALAGNTAIELPATGGVHLQFGAGLNLSRAGVKVLRVAEGTNDRVQAFGTAGLFRRGETVDWGLVVDWQNATYYDAWNLGQVRGEVGVHATAKDDVGLFGMAPLTSAETSLLGGNYRLRAIPQVSPFWRHHWDSGGVTTFWLGMAGRHGTDIALLPDDHITGYVPVFGLEVFIPLNDRVALFGQGNYVTPSDTGTLDAYLGFMIVPGGGLRRGRGGRCVPAGRPLLAVANNPTFSVDLRRR